MITWRLLDVLVWHCMRWWSWCCLCRADVEMAVYANLGCSVDNSAQRQWDWRILLIEWGIARYLWNLRIWQARINSKKVDMLHFLFDSIELLHYSWVCRFSKDNGILSRLFLFTGSVHPVGCSKQTARGNQNATPNDELKKRWRSPMSISNRVRKSGLPMIVTSSLYSNAVEGRTTLVRLGMSKRHSIHSTITLENDVMRIGERATDFALSGECNEFRQI